MPTAHEKPRVLIFVVAYNAEKTIEDVLGRIPKTLHDYDTEILVIDDASADATFHVAERARAAGHCQFKLTVLVNPVNHGYGGNQKLGFLYALQHRFDVVALLHGDGQYAPEALPDLLDPVLRGEADAVFGSRMMTSWGAIKGGMPLYKYFGNRILTFYQNLLLRTKFSEFHSGYRVYSTEALRSIPFHLNSNEFHFDSEIIIQLLLAKRRIKEIPIPTYYGDEICHVNGMSYAWHVVATTTVARLQEYSLVYRRNYDLDPDAPASRRYEAKLGYDSSHSAALELVDAGTTIVDVGCAAGHLCEPLKAKGCRVIGVDRFPGAATAGLDEFVCHDLDLGEFPIELKDVDYVLILDVIEHLRSPERFVSGLQRAMSVATNLQVIVSTANIGYLIPRIMHLFGHFNYGKRGILDLTHTRLFTFASLRRLFEESGFEVVAVRGIPAPFPLVVTSPRMANVLLRLNQLLIRLSRSLFAYQILLVVKPRPMLDALLGATLAHTDQRLAN